jgi:hypothetical protein
MKDKYYVLKDDKGNDRVTVCLVEGGEKVARGIAICDWSDYFDLKTGKEKSYRNAVRALRGRRCDSVRKKQAIDILILTKAPFLLKGEISPCLSFFERRLLYGRDSLIDENKKKSETWKVKVTIGDNTNNMFPSWDQPGRTLNVHRDAVDEIRFM